MAELHIPETLRDLVLIELERQAYAGVIAPSDPAPADTVVEIRVPSIALQGQGINPTLWLHLPATIRLLKGDVEVRTSSLSTVGEGHKFRRWARDDAREFRQQVGVELERLAKKIVDDLLSQPRE